MANTNPLVQALFTDRYQLSMAYAYWKAGRHELPATFDLFFRKCPFGGEFAIFAGLAEALEYVKDFRFSALDIAHLKKQASFSHCEKEFFDWLMKIDMFGVTITAPPEGAAVFPRVPLLTVEGPLAVCQLLETALLNLINYPSLVATNAARFRLEAGPDKTLSEFGLRRAQGPDGGLTASRAAYIGGFNSTSNELAGKLFDIPVSGTHAHSFVQAEFPHDLHRLRPVKGINGYNDCEDLTADALACLDLMRDFGIFSGETNQGELAAFLDYACAFPNSFLALIDTYDVMQSGLMNFLAVAVALSNAGYKPLGVRIDSGDLSHLSFKIRDVFRLMKSNFFHSHWFDSMESNFCHSNWFDDLIIVASNDINEETLRSLNAQGHEIDVFGIGTHLVTCQTQPAFGGVYKLVALNGRPCIKLSEDPVKTTLPGKKKAYRLYGKDGKAILDLLTVADEAAPLAGQPVVCRHPFIESKRVTVIPSRVEAVHQTVFAGEGIKGAAVGDLAAARQLVQSELASNIRPDHLRALNPTPYKVSVSQALYDRLHQLMQSEAPMEVIS